MTALLSLNMTKSLVGHFLSNTRIKGNGRFIVSSIFEFLYLNF